MALTLEELRKQRAELVTKIKEMGAAYRESGSWKDKEQENNWDKANADESKLADDIRKLENAASVDARLREIDDFDSRSVNQTIPGRDDRTFSGAPTGNVPVTEEERAIAMSGFCRAQFDMNVDEQTQEIMRRCGINPGSKQLIFNLPSSQYTNDCARDFRMKNRAGAEQRNMSASIASTGGVLAPPSFLRSMEINMLAFGGIRQVAETITTGSGERMSWPTFDDTGNQATRLGEGQSVGNSVDPTLGAVYWDAYKYTSVVTVPYELLEDSFLDLPSLLGTALGTRLGRKTSKDYTTATGNSAPKGIMVAAGLGYTAASATAVIYDDIVNLIHSVDPAYREAPGVGFLMHDSMIKNLRLIKDTQGRPLWQDGMGVGSPDTLFGYHVNRSQDMDSTMASGKKTILFGELSAYKIRRVNQVRFYRLQERYRDQDLDGFVVLLREDGNLLTSSTLPVKYLQH